MRKMKNSAQNYKFVNFFIEFIRNVIVCVYVKNSVKKAKYLGEKTQLANGRKCKKSGKKSETVISWIKE